MRLNHNRIRRIERAQNRRYIRFASRRFMRLFQSIIDQNYLVNDLQFFNAYVDIYEYIGLQSASLEFQEIRDREGLKSKPPTFFLDSWRAYFENQVRTRLASRVTEVTQTTRSLIQDALVTAQNEGLLSTEIAKAVNAVVKNPSRALMIARTESTYANSLGKELSASQWAHETNQELFKVWIHSGNANERPSHVAAQGNPIPQRDDFVVDGERLAYPGDPRGSAGNIINCGCTVVMMSKQFVDRNYR